MHFCKRGRAGLRKRSGVSSARCPHRGLPTSSWQRSSRSGPAPASVNGRRNVRDEPTNSNLAEDALSVPLSNGATNDRCSALRSPDDGARHKSPASCQTPASAQRQSCHLGAAVPHGERIVRRRLRLPVRGVIDSRTVFPSLVPRTQRPRQAANRTHGRAPAERLDQHRERSCSARYSLTLGNECSRTHEAREHMKLSRSLFAWYLRTNVRTLGAGRAKPNAQTALLIRLVQ